MIISFLSEVFNHYLFSSKI